MAMRRKSNVLQTNWENENRAHFLWVAPAGPSSLAKNPGNSMIAIDGNGVAELIAELFVAGHDFVHFAKPGLGRGRRLPQQRQIDDSQKMPCSCGHGSLLCCGSGGFCGFKKREDATHFDRAWHPARPGLLRIRKNVRRTSEVRRT